VNDHHNHSEELDEYPVQKVTARVVMKWIHSYPALIRASLSESNDEKGVAVPEKTRPA
jgi:hypothetical protein